MWSKKKKNKIWGKNCGKSLLYVSTHGSEKELTKKKKRKFIGNKLYLDGNVTGFFVLL